MRILQKSGTSRFILLLTAVFGLIIFIDSCSLTGSDPQSSEELDRVMDSIKLVFVPDRRVQIFDYSINDNKEGISGRTSNGDAYDQVLGLKARYPELNLDSFEMISPIDTALINVSVGNMRSEPRHSAELSTQVLMGQQVIVWDQDGYWYYVQSPDEYLGWIDGGALTFPDREQLTQYHQADKVMYVNDFGFCYYTSDKNGGVISDLVAGDILVTTGKEPPFYKVVIPGGRKGYVPSEAVIAFRDIAGSPLPDWPDIKATSLKFMGRPYLWGGTSGKGVDCSGFTKMVYYLNGLELPRDASQQVNSGTPIPLDDNLSQLEPGDFLFFGKKGSDGEKDRVTHVAIYLGDGRIIHSSERVQVQSLKPGDHDYAPHRRNTLLSARRMIANGVLADGVEMIKNQPGYGF